MQHSTHRVHYLLCWCDYRRHNMEKTEEAEVWGVVRYSPFGTAGSTKIHMRNMTFTYIQRKKAAVS